MHAMSVAEGRVKGWAYCLEYVVVVGEALVPLYYCELLLQAAQLLCLYRMLLSSFPLITFGCDWRSWLLLALASPSVKCTAMLRLCKGML